MKTETASKTSADDLAPVFAALGQGTRLEVIRVVAGGLSRGAGGR